MTCAILSRNNMAGNSTITAADKLASNLYDFKSYNIFYYQLYLAMYPRHHKLSLTFGFLYLLDNHTGA